MKIDLLFNTPLVVCSTAIRTCWDSNSKSDGGGPKDKELIDRVGNKYKHKSTLEHLVYSFNIKGISRACLQELARHRIASYSVKSTRYTLKELSKTPDEELGKFVIDKYKYDPIVLDLLREIKIKLRGGVSNDNIKHLIPECYKTSLVMTINARSLQNFLRLRTNKSAFWEIQELARGMFEVLPEEHKYLFKGEIDGNN